MIDARVDGVPCVTTLPDLDAAAFAEERLGVHLYPWQLGFLNNQRPEAASPRRPRDEYSFRAR